MGAATVLASLPAPHARRVGGACPWPFTPVEAKAKAYIPVADPAEGTEHLHCFAYVTDTDGFDPVSADIDLLAAASCSVPACQVRIERNSSVFRATYSSLLITKLQLPLQQSRPRLGKTAQLLVDHIHDEMIPHRDTSEPVGTGLVAASSTISLVLSEVAGRPRCPTCPRHSVLRK